MHAKSDKPAKSVKNRVDEPLENRRKGVRAAPGWAGIKPGANQASAGPKNSKRGGDDGSIIP
jgi:hypothetical protein